MILHFDVSKAESALNQLQANGCLEYMLINCNWYVDVLKEPKGLPDHMRGYYQYSQELHNKCTLLNDNIIEEFL
jgi:hypothetical protein